VLFSPGSLHASLVDAGFKQIEPHWHGMAVFSMYAESTAIANGTMAQGTNGPIIPSVAAVIDELREMKQPTQREFLTFSARK
jgi:hypothetical protein